MGRFSINDTANRKRNTAEISEAVDYLNQKKGQLELYTLFAQSQLRRISALRLQTSAVVSSSAYLGKQLKRAMSSLSSFLSDASRIKASTIEGSVVIRAMRAQYDLPRVQREINMSGREFASQATVIAISTLQDLQEMRRDHERPVHDAVTTIDRVDRLVNGAFAQQASYRIPDLI